MMPLSKDVSRRVPPRLIGGALLGLLLSLPCRSQAPHDLAFVREHLEFRLVPGEGTALSRPADLFELTGMYAFRNLGDQPCVRRILYPVPVDDHMGNLEGLEARWMPEDEILTPVRQDSSSVTLELRLDPGEERLLSIRYRQPVRGGRFTYLLTTARGWGRPIEEAEFLLRLPAGVRADSCSLQPDNCRSNAEETLCYWQRRDFVPTQEFVVWFSTAPPDHPR